MSSSTEGLCTGSTHDYLLNSDDDEDKLHQSVTPRTRRRFNNSQTSPSSQSDLDEFVLLEIGDLLSNVPQINDNFSVINKIGSGTFSSVYVAKLKNLPHVKQMFALKYLIPTSHPSRIENELKCLQQIGGSDHVMGVKACLRERDHVVIVMPYFPHDKFQDYVKELTVSEVREYMRAMLISLKRVHSADIIHRDVKPSNFLYNRNIQQYALVDFGLAQKVPGKSGDACKLGVMSKPHSGHHDGKLKHKPVREDVTGPGRPKQRQSKELERQQAQKRKHSDSNNTENSPRKKRQTDDTISDVKEQAKPLAERDVNIPHNTTSPHKSSLLKLDPLRRGDGSLGAVKDKSLSRALLRRRALESLTTQEEVQEKGAKNAVQVAPPGGSGQKPVACSVVVDKMGKQLYRTLASSSTCDCYGKPQICTLCSARSNQHAPRAGTPGFRAPEVLLKCPDQTTAVDIWSAGVIFLSLLSGRYPFFKAPDDVTALAQIISVFGTKAMQRAAKTLGKSLITSPDMPTVDLELACQKLRGCPKRNTTSSSQTPPSSKDRTRQPPCDLNGHTDSGGWDSVPVTAFELLHKLMDLNPYTRITAEEALLHPFFS